MRRTAPVLLAAALALGAVAAEGDDLTDHPCYDAETDALAYPEQQVWFHAGDSKLGNTAAAPWDTTAPDASVQDGAGAGALSSSDVVIGSTAGQETPSATFTGTFTGCIDTMLFDVYSFDPANRTGTSGSAEPAEHDFSLRITVDGQEVFAGGPLQAATTFANDGMGPNLNRFALDLSETLELYASFTEGFELVGEHTIEVEMAAWYVNTGHSVYVWDTTEVPSGITFNGEVTEDYPSL